MAVIAVARQISALGDKVSSLAAEALGYKFVDKRMIEERLWDAGLTKDILDKYDEKKPGFIASMTKNRDLYFHYLKTAVLTEAAEGNIIIIGRGAFAILGGIPGVFSVRFVSSMETRVKRTMEDFECGEKEAQQIVTKSDNDRSGFHNSFFNVDWEDPVHYHLVLNTDLLSPESSAGIIESAVEKAVSAEDVQKGDAVIKQRLLAQKIVNCILFEEGIQVHFLDAVVEVRDNGASLKDVAVLVRNNASGASVAGFLIANGIRVITDDSLKVRSSVTVRRLVSLLSYVDNPSDSISGYLSSALDVSIPDEYHSLEDLCESLLRGLKERDEDLFRSEVLYIQSFMDCVSDYTRTEGNSLRGFLKRWSETDPAISSPDAGDSVRVMTIHKSKGLDFQYVIVPFIEKVTLFKSDNHWCFPDFSGDSLPEVCRGIYDVTLSSASESTLFAEDYRAELLKQYIDNINVLYVAMTRARRGMHLIGEMPSDKFISGLADGVWQKFSNFSQALYNYVQAEHVQGLSSRMHEDGSQRFSVGQIPQDWTGKDSGKAVQQLDMTYPSWPLNPPDGLPRLILGRSQSDFFSEDGDTGVSASERIRGIVLHDILAGVSVQDDLDMVVRQAVLDGSLDKEQAEEAMSLLSARIVSAKGRGWFREDAAVYTERDIVDVDGSVHRPDRVEIYPDGRVCIIDYKFGKEKPEYRDQVALYADIYRRMGYVDVTSAVWYVFQDYVDMQ